MPRSAVIEMKAHAEERAMTNVSVADGQHDIDMKAHAEERCSSATDTFIVV